MDGPTVDLPRSSSDNAIDIQQHLPPEQQQPPSGVKEQHDEPPSSPKESPKPKRKARASNPDKKEAARTTSIPIDAHFFAGLSSTLKHIQRRDRELRLSSLQIV